MRVFNKKINDNTIDKFYIETFKEMEIGFNEIIVKNKKEQEMVIDLTKFLCIYPYVKVTIKNKK